MRKRLVLALFAGLALAPRSGADVANLDGILDDSLQDVQDAAQSLLDGDRVAAIGFLGEALLEANSAVLAVADPVTVAELGARAAAVTKKVAAFRKAVLAARDSMANTNAADLKAVKAAGKAAKMGLGAKTAFAKIPSRGPTPFEQNARSAGFHKPGDTVTFTVYPGLDADKNPCVDPPTFTVVDPYGNGAVVPGTPVSVLNDDGSYTVTVHMGPGGGSGRLEVTGCGVTRNGLLFNYGEVGTFPSKLSADRFDGAYTGSFTGTAYASGGGSNPVNGTVQLSVAGGVITVTDPGSGTGSVNAKGNAGLIGAGVVGGDTYSFDGKFIALSFDGGAGSAEVHGTWRAFFTGGTAAGRWSAAR